MQPPENLIVIDPCGRKYAFIQAFSQSVSDQVS